MLSELDNLRIELKSTTVPVRLKAFNKLYSIFNGRLSELQQALDQAVDITWDALFKAAHQGVLLHSQKFWNLNTVLQENDPKITNYSRVLLIICDSCANAKTGIPYEVLTSLVNDALRDEGTLNYFGKCYIQILRNSILKPENNLSPIRLDLWKSILEILFKLMKSKRHTIPFMEIVSCTQQVIELGCAFSQLSQDLFKCLDLLTKRLDKRTIDQEKLELLVIAYHCCRNIAVDYRFEVCRFTEINAKHIHSLFKVELSEKVKEILFKLMDLALIVHYPKISSDKSDQEYIHDRRLWHPQLRNFAYMVNLELNFARKSKYRAHSKEDEFNHVLTQFAARLSYLIYWNDSVWVEEEDDEPAAAKRIKRANKLQSLIDMAQPSNDKTECNWKWIVVIGEVIYNYPDALTNEDYHAVLQMLSGAQPSISSEIEVYAFTKCCYVLLQRAIDFNSTANNIIVNHCNELWHKIADGAARVCTLSNKQPLESHILLQTLIWHQKYPSNSFIEEVIKIFLTNSTLKCDATLMTLVTVMKSFNLDLLSNGKELAKKILVYTFEKSSVARLKQMITTEKCGKPSSSVLSLVGTICCLSKTDVVNHSKQEKLDADKMFQDNWKLEQQISYKQEVAKIVKLMLLKCNERLLIEDEDFLDNGDDDEEDVDQRRQGDDFPKEIKCILDPELYEELQRLTEVKEKILDESKDIGEIKEYLVQVIENTEILMSIASNLIKFEALNEEKFTNSFFAKKIDFNVQRIEQLFEMILQKRTALDLIETNQLLELVKSLFSSKYHMKISLRIRSFELDSCLLWVSKQVNREFIDNRTADTKVMKIGWNEFKNAKMEEKLKFVASETLFEYNNCKGVNEDTFSNRVKLIEINCDSNMDLHLVFHVLNLIGRQSAVPRAAIEWIWQYVIEICRKHNGNQYLIHQLFKSLKDIVYMSKNYEDMNSNIVALFTSFSTLCAEQSYSESVTVAFIQQFKFFHKKHFQLYDENNVAVMYNQVVDNFLNSKLFAIRMAAIKTVASILHNDIENVNMEVLLHSNRNNQKMIFKNVLRKQCIVNNGMEIDTDAPVDDERMNSIAASFQLFSSLFCVNFVFRKPLIMEISKLLVRHKIPEPVAIKVYNKILKFLKCDSQSLMDNKSIVHWMSQWILDGNNIFLFPWYFAGAESLQAFMDLHYELAALTILKNSTAKIDDFCNHIEFPLKKLVTSILPACLSFMLPIEAGCNGIKYERKAEEMKAKIDSLIPLTDQRSTMLRKTSCVIGYALENVYDVSKFKDICGFDFEVTCSVEMIDCASFDRCLNHLKKYFSIPAMNANHSILTFFCTKQLYAHFIEKLLRIQKKRVQSTMLKEHKLFYLLQYCILAEKLLEYLNEPIVATYYDIKGFIIRDITHFLCFLLLDEINGMRMRETASNFLSMFLKKILPKCADDLKPVLNKIVSSLVTICKTIKGIRRTDFESKCMSIIEWLVLRQSEVLENEIRSLDMFPENQEFHEIRQKQLEVKYKNGPFTLTQEIEHFLKVKKRMVEGLVELRTHLADNKVELKHLFEELTSTLGFSEDGEQNILHKLICSLVGYARNLPDIPGNEVRAVEAVKCLGEIGNYDLSTMVFITEDHQTTTIYRKIDEMVECQKMICHAVLHQMETMILHHNPRIFEPASSACYNLLTSVSSHDFDLSVYLRPFDTKKENGNSIFYNSPKAEKTIDFIEILQNNEYSTYKTWIKRLCGEMLIFAGNKSLELVTSAQKSFAEMLNTLMVQLLLCFDDMGVNKVVIDGVNFFFATTADKINYPKVNEGSMFLNKLAIRQMLTVVECIRMHCLDHPQSNMAATMDLNCLNIAKAAKYCEAYFTAVLYCEMWAEKRLKIEQVPFETSMSHKTLQEIMYESLKAIGIHDASSLFINPFTNRSLYLQSRNKNWQNILEHDANGDQPEAYNSLANDLELHFLSRLLAKYKTLSSHQYECLWRMADWNVLIECDSETKDQSTVIDYREEFEKFHYSGLKCMKNGDELGVKIAINKARKSILQMLQQESLECTKNLYKFLGMSQLLQQVDDFADVRFNRHRQVSHVKLQNKWELQNQLPHDFRLIEPVLSQRNSIFDTANIKTGRRTWIPEALQSNMLYIVKESIEAGCEADAIKNIAKLRSLSNLATANKAEMLIREAQLNFKSNVNLSKFCLKQLIENKEFEREFLQRSFAYRLYGEILADNFADNIDTIHVSYFKQSINYLERYAHLHKKSHLVVDVDKKLSQQPLTQDNEDDQDVVGKIREQIGVFESVAKYFDREYVWRSEYLVSTDFKRKKVAFEKNKEKMAMFQEDYRVTKNREKGKSFVIMRKSLEIDQVEIESAEKETKRAAGLAIMYYLRSVLNDPGDSTLSIFRIVSIWLSNLNKKTIRTMIDTSVDKIPSYKFVVVLPQLVVRLNDQTTDPSNRLLMKILTRSALEHPHHTLPLILALVNSYADSPEAGGHKQDEPRVVGAQILWEKLKVRPELASITVQMEKMSSALIDLANKDCERMPKNHQVLFLRNLDEVQCPTMELPVMRDGNYQHCLKSVVKWTCELVNVGGINAPKKIFCLCSDGVERAQLLKGKDDMRQDAVMQQVFSAVNQMLKSNKEMKKQHARIRTYKVVPLSRRSGILEWCNNTIPVGTYLCGDRSKDPVKSKGAHERYNPDDWKPSACMEELHKCDTASFEKKEEVFKVICDNIQPAFHHFFNENFKNPGQWFERRLAYTISVAVSSMVGYILGIGDRHVQNILIDYNSAEIVHIDFGIAFEQGKILPHKEMVPFRLTRDMIAPMGICGVDGVFRETCKKTMKIMRENEKTLTTILEILLYDPMYSWTISSKKAQRRQLDDAADATTDDEASTDDDRDSMASRALLRVQAKLKGKADDSIGYASVEGQVECLIQMAVSTSFLSRLFKGWQAYL